MMWRWPASTRAGAAAGCRPSDAAPPGRPRARSRRLEDAGIAGEADGQRENEQDRQGDEFGDGEHGRCHVLLSNGSVRRPACYARRRGRRHGGQLADAEFTSTGASCGSGCGAHELDTETLRVCGGFVRNARMADRDRNDGLPVVRDGSPCASASIGRLPLFRNAHAGTQPPG